MSHFLCRLNNDVVVSFICSKYCIEYFYNEDGSVDFSNYVFWDCNNNIIGILPNDGSVKYIDEVHINV